jgi:hypothetical protein
MTPLAWVKGLIAAVICGAATAVTSIGGAMAFGSPLDWKQISAVAISAGFFSGAAYLKQSPIPEDEVPNVVVIHGNDVKL